MHYYINTAALIHHHYYIITLHHHYSFTFKAITTSLLHHYYIITTWLFWRPITTSLLPLLPMLPPPTWRRGRRARSESVLAPCPMLAQPVSIELIDLPFFHLSFVAVKQPSPHLAAAAACAACGEPHSDKSTRDSDGGQSLSPPFT